jgi:hypothetical protein
MNGWHVFSYFLGALSCVFVLGWRTYKDPDRDDDSGCSCFDDEEDTQVYVKRCDSFYWQYRCINNEGHPWMHRAIGDDGTVYRWD